MNRLYVSLACGTVAGAYYAAGIYALWAAVLEPLVPALAGGG